MTYGGHLQSVIKSWAILALVALFSFLLIACDNNAEKNITIGVVAETSFTDGLIDAFKEGMAELGYIEGDNVSYIFNGNTGSDTDTVDYEINKLLAQKINIPYTIGNLPARRAKQAVKGLDFPVVFAAVVNPVGENIVESISHPGGNLTGVQVGMEIPKALEWMATVIPDLRKVFVPYNLDEEVSVSFLDFLAPTARQLNLELIHGEVHSIEEAVSAISNLPADVQGVFWIPSPTLDTSQNELSRAAIERKLPIISGHTTRDKSVVMTFSITAVEVAGQAARLTSQILKGANPADLPVETPEFSTVINLKTARDIGLEIPDAEILAADQIIR